MEKNSFSTKDLIYIAMFASLTAVLSQLIIPLPFSPVPVTLSTLAIFLAGGLLSPLKATISQVVYILLGLIGLPVFAGFESGIGALLGPTGGYLIGYILAALIISSLKIIIQKNLMSYCITMSIGLISCYFLGTLQFMYVTNSSLLVALSLCVFPFLIGDFVKIIIAGILVLKLERHITNTFDK